MLSYSAMAGNSKSNGEQRGQLVTVYDVDHGGYPSPEDEIAIEQQRRHFRPPQRQPLITFLLSPYSEVRCSDLLFCSGVMAA